ncbi:MAG: fibronectin type III domain-containing protein [candidate division Zixibacteria bacterium]|nr:fibronectin type III domain-containing protein [candidate division Zixibacteria bacterium]
MKPLLITVSLLSLMTAASFAQSDPPVEQPMATDSTMVASTPSITPPAPVSSLEAKDSPDDHGHSITLSWEPSADDGAGAATVTSYVIYHSTSPEGPFDSVGSAISGATTFTHSSAKESDAAGFLADYVDRYYRIDAVTADQTIRTPSSVVGPVQSSGQWYNDGRTPVAVAVAFFGLLSLFFLKRAKAGADLYVRPLGGIEAVDEAIGRATEMGKPILYVLGLGTASDISTIASFTILGRVAKRVAEYQTHLIVPCYDPIVMAVAQETVKAAYMDAGRPDDYKEDMVYFLTNSQFGYVGAVNGIMLRQLPATNVYMGKFYAESLLLAETGALAGSIQISGTDEVAQIPFFVVACDYTLIGEELYAASAYLGREPLLLGSLKAQDYAKAAVIICALLGALALNIAAASNATWGLTFKEFFKVTN